MARKANGLVMKNNLEPTVGAPLDGRQLVKKKEDLFAEGSFPFSYKGMIVAVREESRAYMLTGDPTLEESWAKISTDADETEQVDLSGYATVEATNGMKQELDGRIGDLNSLDTTSKNDLVGAINETRTEMSVQIGNIEALLQTV